MAKRPLASEFESFLFFRSTVRVENNLRSVFHHEPEHSVDYFPFHHHKNHETQLWE